MNSATQQQKISEIESALGLTHDEILRSQRQTQSEIERLNLKSIQEIRSVSTEYRKKLEKVTAAISDKASPPRLARLRAESNAALRASLIRQFSPSSKNPPGIFPGLPSPMSSVRPKMIHWRPPFRSMTVTPLGGYSPGPGSAHFENLIPGSGTVLSGGKLQPYSSDTGSFSDVTIGLQSAKIEVAVGMTPWDNPNPVLDIAEYPEAGGGDYNWAYGGVSGLLAFDTAGVNSSAVVNFDLTMGDGSLPYQYLGTNYGTGEMMIYGCVSLTGMFSPSEVIPVVHERFYLKQFPFEEPAGEEPIGFYHPKVSISAQLEMAGTSRTNFILPSVRVDLYAIRYLDPIDDYRRGNVNLCFTEDANSGWFANGGPISVDNLSAWVIY
jgi:hypothetical protein